MPLKMISGTTRQLLGILRRDAPKLGRDEAADSLADDVLDAFADSLKGLVNERGGIFRAGTGSAMYYIWHAKELGYTCDGHEPGASPSPPTSRRRCCCATRGRSA